MSTTCLPTPRDPRWLPQSHAYVVLAEHEKKEKLETDAMFRLEHGEADRTTLKKALPTLSHIQEAQNAWKDDFALNSMLRRHFRVRKPHSGHQLAQSWETVVQTCVPSSHLQAGHFPSEPQVPCMQHRVMSLPNLFLLL